jgi:Ca2+-binding EF-hand superfamily protein
MPEPVMPASPYLRPTTATLATLLAIAAGMVSAQTIVPKLDEEGRRGEMARKIKERSAEQFDQADANKDGKLSKDEVATVSSYKAESFEKLDLDKDGFLSWEEFVGHKRWAK